MMKSEETTKFTDKSMTNVGIRNHKNYFENGFIYDQNLLFFGRL